MRCSIWRSRSPCSPCSAHCARGSGAAWYVGWAALAAGAAGEGHRRAGRHRARRRALGALGALGMRPRRRTAASAAWLGGVALCVAARRAVGDRAVAAGGCRRVRAIGRPLHGRPLSRHDRESKRAGLVLRARRDLGIFPVVGVSGPGAGPALARPRAMGASTGSLARLAFVWCDRAVRVLQFRANKTAELYRSRAAGLRCDRRHLVRSASSSERDRRAALAWTAIVPATIVGVWPSRWRPSRTPTA